MNLRKVLDIKNEGRLIAIAAERMDFEKAIGSLIRFYNSIFARKNGGKKVGDGMEIVVSDGHGLEGYTILNGEVKKVVYHAHKHWHNFEDVEKRNFERGERLIVHYTDSYKD